MKTTVSRAFFTAAIILLAALVLGFIMRCIL